MDLSLSSRFKNAWNAFRNRAPTMMSQNIGSGYSYRPDRFRLTRGNERSIVTSVYNRIALDVAAINIQHVQLDDEGRFLNVIKSGLNECLSLEANLDQTGRAFIQDVVMSMMDEGCVAIVPVDTDDDPDDTKGYQILSMRVGRIRDWYPRHVRVEVYNENTGRKQEIVVPKDTVAIVENPLYAVINEPNSTMQRLIRKLNLLDAVDEQSSSGKLDLIIQLPYVIKSEARRQQAEKRRKDIEQQLSGSKYGIAYTDGTERITQLNRSLENNLMKQIEYLTSMLYSQLGITQSILDGTADEKTMLNYYNRTIEPIISAIGVDIKNFNDLERIDSELQAINSTLTGSEWQLRSSVNQKELFEQMNYSLSLLGNGAAILLIVIGLINFVNVMLTGVVARKNEFAIMESIGTTKKQIMKILTLEGGIYALISTLLIMTFGNAFLMLVADAVPHMANYAVFKYPVALVIGLIAAIFVICLSVPAIVHKATSDETVIERLHNFEN